DGRFSFTRLAASGWHSAALDPSQAATGHFGVPEHLGEVRQMQHRARPPRDHRDAAARFRLLADIEPWPNLRHHFQRLAARHEELAAAGSCVVAPGNTGKLAPTIRAR